VRVIDLSKPVRFNREDPLFMQVRIKHKPRWMARLLVRLLGLPFKLMPHDFCGWADETITKMGVHSTTHIDAPWHYGPISGSKPAQTIDQIPLESCLGPGLVLDMTHKPDDDPITARDMEEALEQSGGELGPGTIVLIRTGRDRHIGTKNYWKTGTGMSAAATEWLLDCGITVAGIDQWGWDLPFRAQIAKARSTRNADLFWEAHRVGQRRPFWHMEQLVNLDKLPPHGFEVGVFPLPIVGASAAPARVVAILR
jgi:kynurenine formamidase